MKASYRPLTPQKLDSISKSVTRVKNKFPINLFSRYINGEITLQEYNSFKNPAVKIPHNHIKQKT